MSRTENAPFRTAFERRALLKAVTAAGIAAPLGLSLASCAAGGSSGGNSGGTATGKVTAGNPFGVASGSTVDVVIFDGGFGTEYAEYDAKLLEAEQDGVTAKVSGTTQIAQQMQPRFVGGNPPDLLHNAGAQSIGLSSIASQLVDLSDVVEADNLDGTKIKDTLYPNVLAVNDYNGKMATLYYALTVYALWYSKSLFDDNGWTPPKTWDEALQLGAAAKEQGKYLFTWGKEAASYYHTLVLDSAIKSGGDEIRLKMANLEPDAWSQEAVTDTLAALEKVVSQGYMRPGGAGTQFTEAQAQWSQSQEALLYPSGSWIENEMANTTADNFVMTGAPAPTLPGPVMPYEALNNTPNEMFVVGAKAANAAGGKEFLRVMLSKDAATQFVKLNKALTIVADTVPDDAFGSSALASQVAMLDDAGKNTFNYNFYQTYGLTTDINVLWNSFLSGQSSAKDLASGMQDVLDRVREDDSIEKVKVS